MGKNMPQIDENHVKLFYLFNSSIFQPVNEIFERRRKEIRAKTVRDQPLTQTRFEKLTSETPKPETIPISKQKDVKKEDDDGYM